MKELMHFLKQTMNFHGIDPDEITNIEENCGTVWFECEGQKYFLSIAECEDDDEEQDEQEGVVLDPTKDQIIRTEKSK